MAITSSAGAGITITSSAKTGNVKSFTGGKVRLQDPITTGNNGNLMASPVYTGRLIYISAGTGVGQTRFISGQTTAQGDGDDVDLDVTEPWATNPDSSSVFRISYIIEDAATVSGLTLRSQSQVYESSRRLTIGSGGGTFAFFFLAGDKAFEWRDEGSTTVGAVTVEDGGRFDVGYNLAGSAVFGGYCTCIQNTAGELALDCKTGSVTNFYDWNLRCSHANNTTELDGGTHTWKRGKTFRAARAMLLSGTVLVEDWVWEGSGTANNTIRIEDTVDIQSCVLTAMNGFESLDDGTAEVLTVRNANFVTPFQRIVRVHDDKTWYFADPAGWLANSTAISFEVDDLNSVNKVHRLTLRVQQPDGTAIEGAESFVYEGLLNQNLPTVNKVTSDAAGSAVSDVLEERYTFPSSVFTTQTSGGHAIKVYKYARRAFAGSQAFDDTLALTGIRRVISMASDSNVTEADAQQATEDGPLLSAIVRHGPGETDIRPLKVLHYDGGSGSVPTIGETITAGSATGVVLDYEGDGVDGILVLESWNGTEFTNNVTMSGSSSSFNGVTDTTGGGESFYQEYTWVWDLNGGSMQAAYNYQSAKFSNRRHPIAKQDDGGSFTTYTDAAKSENTGDVNLTPATPVAGDAFYFGDAQALPESITVDVSTAMSASTVTWEYYNGSWTALGGVSDGTNGFTTSGKNIVTFTRPTDAVANSVDSTTAYWIRARLSGTLTGQAIASRIWLDEKIERLIEWGEDEHAFQIQTTPTGFETLRNVNLTEGVWLANRGAGTITQMVSDGGVAYIPPVSRTMTLSPLIAGSEARLFRTSDGVELTGVESSGTSFAYAYEYTTDINVHWHVDHLSYRWRRVNAVLKNEDQTINPFQQPEPAYVNP